MSETWISTKIPREIYKEIKEFIESESPYGYSSVMKFVTDAAREKLDKLKQSNTEKIIFGDKLENAISDFDEVRMRFDLWREEEEQKEEEREAILFNNQKEIKELKKRIETIEKTIKKELGESLESHTPQD